VAFALFGYVVLATHQDLDVVKPYAQDEECQKCVRACLPEAEPGRDAYHFEVGQEYSDNSANSKNQSAVDSVTISHCQETLYHKNVGRHYDENQVPGYHRRKCSNKN